MNFTVSYEKYLATEYGKQKDAYTYSESPTGQWFFYPLLFMRDAILPTSQTGLLKRGATSLVTRSIRSQWTMLLYCPERHLDGILVQCPLVESEPSGPFFDTILAIPPSCGSFAWWGMKFGFRRFDLQNIKCMTPSHFPFFCSSVSQIWLSTFPLFDIPQTKERKHNFWWKCGWWSPFLGILTEIMFSDAVGYSQRILGVFFL